MFAAPRIAIGVGVGGYGPGYYAPPAYAYVPPCPGPDYAWVNGYYGSNNIWVNGYWRAPVVNSYRVGPRYEAPRRSQPGAQRQRLTDAPPRTRLSQAARTERTHGPAFESQRAVPRSASQR